MDQLRRKPTSDFAYQDVSKRKDKNRSHHKSYYNRTPDWHQYESSEFSVGQWNSQAGQRLYPTMSDSAVCGYSLPCDYTINSGYQFYPVCSPMYPIGLEYSRRRVTRRKSKFPHDTESPSNSASNFTSLPPVNLEDVNCNQKRRFSDPGLNNVDESNEASSESSDVDEYDAVNESLIEQITELKSDNKRLVTELETTKDELKTVKSQVSAISSKISCHEPLSLAQMVKEIRDAAQIRENVLLSKVEALIEKCSNTKNMTNISNEIDSLKKRISSLEHQLDHLRIHSKVDGKINGNATPSEIDAIHKKRIEKSDKLSKSLDIETVKKEDSGNLDSVNSDAQETGSDCNGNSLSTVSCESLSSSLGPGSLHSAHVTLCGPVTDL
ncbi:uncharacterized protein LOC135839524 isoform X2 [Planococcus citri]|uniref:uncharacterized protein LOC135839524 isoform X2 n=1 Tax=Planococcus citri TaxID=170843 RepID=UPI0031F8F49C